MDTLKKIDIGAIREWTYIGCDGPPCFLASRLIESEPQTYDWVTLLVCLGHLSINQIKGYFKVLGKICFNVLGNDALNFKSPTAYKYFTEAKDNHKFWQAFEIFLHGTMLGLIHTCLLQCKEDTSPIGFLKWERETTSDTMKLIFQLVLTYGQGIYAQRVGERNNDMHVSDAGRYAFIDWFYGFNHPIYREIEYRNLRNKALYPKEVKRQRSKIFLDSSADIDARKQEGDFLLD